MSNKQNTEENTHEASVMDDEQRGVVRSEDAKAESQDVASVEPREEDVESLQEALEEAKRQGADNWDKFMRAQAELDNVVKRSKRDLENAHKFALQAFVSELLVVRDSLEKGLEHTKDQEIDPDSLKEGSELTLRTLTQAMEKFNVAQIDPPKGEPFDPKLHEAMAMVSSDEVEPNCVLDVIQKGYLLNDRLIRPARVVVVKPLDE